MSALKGESDIPRSRSKVVLMDVCLEGGREGIEAARWLP
jgi:hypothetical protein